MEIDSSQLVGLAQIVKAATEPKPAVQPTLTAKPTQPALTAKPTQPTSYTVGRDGYDRRTQGTADSYGKRELGPEEYEVLVNPAQARAAKVRAYSRRPRYIPKTSQDNSEDEKPARPKRRKPSVAPYPDFNKSLVTQNRAHPVRAGVGRAVQTGGLGAVLGALLARLATDNPAIVGGGAAAGGLIGAIPGYRSGKQEAESDYSRLLFLRRRLGINEPGELEVLLRHPELAAQAIKTSGALSGLASVLKSGPARTLAGGAGGAALGYYGTPYAGGYEDVEPARRFSALIDGVLGAAIGNQSTRGVKELTKLPAVAKGLTAFGGGELATQGMATMYRQRNAMESLGDAGKELAESSKVTSIPYNIQQALQSPTGRGAGAGATVAALASILTGLSRGQSDREIRKDRGRAGMVGADFMKYVIPAMVAGGVLGSVNGKRAPGQ